MDLVRKWLLVPALLVVASFLPRVAAADLAPNDGFGYLIISAPESDFTLGNSDTEEGPSGTILLRVGHFVGGTSVLDARFIVESLPPFALPEGTTLSDLDGAQFTFVGGYQVPSGEESTEPHIVTPTPPDPDALIAQEVQQAVFDATHNGALDSLGFNPDVGQIVDAIIGSNESLSADDVFSAVFSTDVRMIVFGTQAATEGEMFPHQDQQGQGTFHFSGSFWENEDGEIATLFDVCLNVDIDVKPKKDPNVINFKKKKGKLRVAFLSSEGFDATEVVWQTARISGVYAVKGKKKDVNNDGVKDMVVRFKMKELIEDGAITCDTVSLLVTADLEDGTCVRGADLVTVNDHCECEDDDTDEDDED
jgi:hypothetical protein